MTTGQCGRWFGMTVLVAAPALGLWLFVPQPEAHVAPSGSPGAWVRVPVEIVSKDGSSRQVVVTVEPPAER